MAKTKTKNPLVVNMACNGDVQCPVCDVFFNLYCLVAINWDGKCPNCRSEIEIDQDAIELSCAIRSRLNKEQKQLEGMILRRVQWHLDVPVCRILSGIRAHVAALGLKERMWLFYQLGADTAEELVEIMRELTKLRCKHKRRLKTA